MRAASIASAAVITSAMPAAAGTSLRHAARPDAGAALVAERRKYRDAVVALHHLVRHNEALRTMIEAEWNAPRPRRCAIARDGVLERVDFHVGAFHARQNGKMHERNSRGGNFINSTGRAESSTVSLRTKPSLSCVGIRPCS